MVSCIRVFCAAIALPLLLQACSNAFGERVRETVSNDCCRRCADRASR
jgi:hypothetical protein